MEEVTDIAELIHRGGIFKDVEGNTPEVIYEKVSKMIKLPEEMTAEQICEALCAREKVLSTAVGNGIALPHARAPIMKDAADQRICVVYLKEPIEMNAPDEVKVSVMFILLTSNPQNHLKVLSTLAGLFRDSTFKKVLDEKSDEETLIKTIKSIS